MAAPLSLMSSEMQANLENICRIEVGNSGRLLIFE